MFHARHYAHSLPGKPVETWEPLEQHLAETAGLAESFAGSYAPGWGRLVGFWHDIGKYQRAFQERIGRDAEANTNGQVDHSSVGALLALERRAGLAAFVIAGHHGGLPNAEELHSRLLAKRTFLEQARKDGLPRELEEKAVPVPPSWAKECRDKAAFSLWTRLLFSALVDADFLATERFYTGRERELGDRPSLTELKQRLDEHISRKILGAKQSRVNEMRARVLGAARSAAAFAPGAFSLTVPTGGGKTLSSLAFALDHALLHGLGRVIVVIPYTSIIEQTAKEYRLALGDEAVLEHHTNVDPDVENNANRMASENWDAPIVVTTSVQFFESLFANRTSRCRKLHRIAGSVVVFDEVQTFPVHLLGAVRQVLRELTSHYGATTVFCTATQPTLLDGVREIVPDPGREFEVVADRCEILMPGVAHEPVTWEALAEELRTHEQALAIVHRRDDAQRLAELTGEDCLHLSARMCARHRAAVLGEIKARLEAGASCRVAATQLVEAGVDVDFPEVYRAFAGADSLAQAAGRCNREGRGTGRLHVFHAPTRPPRGILRSAEAVASEMLAGQELDVRKPSTFSAYFKRLYNVADQDPRGVLPAERAQKFADVAKLFRMIEDAGEPVVAPYGDWEWRVEEVRQHGVSRERMRRLQPLMVSLYRQEIEKLERAGAIHKVAESFWAVTRVFRPYSQRWGFAWQGTSAIEPEDLIA